jgi:hypothetical protein
MFAWRTVWLVKPRHMAEAVALISKLVSETKGWPGSAVRIYSSKVGPAETLVVEEAWPSIEEHDRWWAAYSQSPEWAAFFEAWYQVVERAVSTDLWNVAEWKW